MIKKIILVLVVVLVLIQLIPKSAPNVASMKSPNDISTAYAVPANVETILQKACYDCHSNTTHYPWYSRIQPIAWWLNDHIVDGKKHFNISEFTAKRPAVQYHKMEELQEQVEEGEMPLASYTLVHTDAKLTAEEKATLINWSKAIRDTMKVRYPADSLVMPRKKKE